MKYQNIKRSYFILFKIKNNNSYALAFYKCHKN